MCPILQIHEQLHTILDVYLNRMIIMQILFLYYKKIKCGQYCKFMSNYIRCSMSKQNEHFLMNDHTL